MLCKGHDGPVFANGVSCYNTQQLILKKFYHSPAGFWRPDFTTFSTTFLPQFYHNFTTFLPRISPHFYHIPRIFYHSLTTHCTASQPTGKNTCGFSEFWPVGQPASHILYSQPASPHRNFSHPHRRGEDPASCRNVVK